MIARQYPCLYKCTEGDALYKYLAKNTPNEFWVEMKDWLPRNQNVYTEDLKSLVNGMLSFKPEERLTIAQIREQPWTRGETATYEEVVDYMNKM